MARRKLAGAALAAHQKKLAEGGGGAPKRRRVARARRNPPRARRNPPVAGMGSLASAAAAVLGGLLGVAAQALFGRVVTNPTVQDVGRIVVPGALAYASTQFRHAQAKPFALGLVGVAGYGVGQAISAAVVQRNPPDIVFDNPADDDEVFDNPDDDEVFDNPPESIVNEGYALFRPAWSDPLRIAAAG